MNLFSMREKYVFYIAILLSIFLFFVRPILDMLKKRGAGNLPLRQIKDVYVKNEKGKIQGAAEAPAIEEKQPSAVTEAMRDKVLVGAIVKEWVREGA